MSKFYCPSSEVLSIHVTEDCNLYCKGCYTFSCKKKVHTVNTETALKAIEKYKPPLVHFYGGEALLYPHIIRNIMKAYPEIKYRIHTNGTTYTDSVKDILDAMEFIYVTVDSFDYQWLKENKLFNQKCYDSFLRLIRDYKEKIVVTRNIGASNNDFFVEEKIIEAGIPKERIENCVMITYDEEQEAIPNKDWLKVSEPRKVPKRAKLRLLTNGEITNDIRGIDNCFSLEEAPKFENFPPLPESKKCIICDCRFHCNAFNMFPAFVKEVIDNVNYEPHFCKIARLYTEEK